jgi:hypothetical protein
MTRLDELKAILAATQQQATGLLRSWARLQEDCHAALATAGAPALKRMLERSAAARDAYQAAREEELRLEAEIGALEDLVP